MTYPITTIGELVPCSCSSRSVNAGIGELESEAVAITSSGWLPTVVWPSDVDAYKRKLDPDMRATDATVSRCANLPAGEAVAWGDFFTSWKAFAAESTPIFGAANKYDEAVSFEQRLHEWQKKIAETCRLNAPAVIPQAGPDTSAIKFVAVAAAVVAIAYLASPLITGARVLGKKR
ncbi:MAG: hypothetical protein EBS48_06820 [Actinobacteria bacterium]|nr:hypothetical protein [Actinomycetota bacterium]